MHGLRNCDLLRYVDLMSIQPEFVIPQFTVADRLRKAREHTGLDQLEFAEELGVSRATVSNNERGVVSPRKIVLKAWALRTGVPVSWLETGEAPAAIGPDGGAAGSNITGG
ncbi:helix-turn-helix domain-containing protein [Paenarthrobacter ilicis]|uniref:helix-turn-helix domain-containing protein n=1 Tax=Paenarthrobacter ilicis TaxID=43665 RepID=UPI00386BAF0A